MTIAVSSPVHQHSQPKVVAQSRRSTQEQHEEMILQRGTVEEIDLALAQKEYDDAARRLKRAQDAVTDVHLSLVDASLTLAQKEFNQAYRVWQTVKKVHQKPKEEEDSDTEVWFDAVDWVPSAGNESRSLNNLNPPIPSGSCRSTTPLPFPLNQATYFASPPVTPKKDK
jgi:hypothetical protein